jgi:hypothetical protein
MEREMSGKAKCGLLRKGNRVYITLQFPTEYDAMQAFDVWSMEDIDIHFKGPKMCIDDENEKDKK